MSTCNRYNERLLCSDCRQLDINTAGSVLAASMHGNKTAAILYTGCVLLLWVYHRLAGLAMHASALKGKRFAARQRQHLKVGQAMPSTTRHPSRCLLLSHIFISLSRKCAQHTMSSFITSTLLLRSSLKLARPATSGSNQTKRCAYIQCV